MSEKTTFQLILSAEKKDHSMYPIISTLSSTEICPTNFQLTDKGEDYTPAKRKRNTGFSKPRPKPKTTTQKGTWIIARHTLL